MSRSIDRRWLPVAVLAWSLLAVGGNSRLAADEPEGIELTFFLAMSPAAFETFVLPDAEDAVGILLAGPSDGGAGAVGVSSSLDPWGGVYSRFKTITYVAKGGVSSA